MRYLYILLICTSAVFAQEPKLGRTVLKECVSSENPRQCTSEKIKNDIASLMTPDVETSLKEKGVTSVIIAYGLILDEKGKVLTDQLEVYCEFDKLKQKVISYFNSLPDFEIAENIHLATEKRALFLGKHVFLFDHVKGTYKMMDDNQAANFSGIHIGQLIGIPPHVKECANSSDPYTCTREKIYAIFNKIVLPEAKKGTYKLNISFSISATGKIIIREITDPSGLFETEARHLLNEIPNLIPASVHGIKYGSRFNLPLTIKL